MVREIIYPAFGENRGAGRIWLEGRRLAEAGLTPGAHYRVLFDESRKTIELRTVSAKEAQALGPRGARKVSRKEKYGATIPVIDLRSKKLNAMFDETLKRLKAVVQDGRITISIQRHDQKRLERLNRFRRKVRQGKAIELGSVFTGVGAMDASFARGLRDAGLRTHQAFVVEKDRDYLEAYTRNNPDRAPDTVLVAGGIEDLDERVSTIDGLVAGLPCTGESRQGKTKRRLKTGEEHPEVGYLFCFLLSMVPQWNPAFILIEQVPDFRLSGTAAAIRGTLRAYGYDLYEIVLDGNEMGALEKRRRVLMLAVTQGMEFTWDGLQPVREKEAHLGDVLDEFAPNDPIWREFAYLKRKEERDKARGAGFREQVRTPDDDHCFTILKGYSKARSGELRIQHPTNPELSRLVTPTEHARLKALPEGLIEGLSNTAGHEVLGQSVIGPKLRAAGRHLGWYVVSDAGAARASDLGQNVLSLPLAKAG